MPPSEARDFFQAVASELRATVIEGLDYIVLGMPDRQRLRFYDWNGFGFVRWSLNGELGDCVRPFGPRLYPVTGRGATMRSGAARAAAFVQSIVERTRASQA